MTPRTPQGNRTRLNRTATNLVLVACLLATAGCAERIDDGNNSENSSGSDKSTSSSAPANADTNADPNSPATAAASSVPLTQERPTPNLPNGVPALLSTDELYNYYDGKFVESTDKHPAYNVSEPSYPDKVTSTELDGVDALVQYMGETYRYTAYTNSEIDGYTGKVYTDDYIYDSSQEKDERTNKEPDGQSKNNNELREEGYWVGPYKYSMQRVPDTEKWSEDKKEVTIKVNHRRESYTWYNQDSEKSNNKYYSWGIQEDFNLTLVYVDGKGWRIKKMDSLHSRWLT